MKKILLITLVLTLALAGSAFAAGVVDSKHDMPDTVSGETTTQVCVYCHHPHRGTAGAAAVGNALLWNITGWTGAPYATYDNTVSSTINYTPITGNNVSSTSGLRSYLCMACHDGSVGASSLLRAPRDGTSGSDYTIASTNAANLGSTLEDDHPVNFDYSTASGDAGIKAESSGGDTGLQVSGASGATYPLFSGEMQCATCHEPHAGGLTGGGTLDGFGNSADDNIEFMRGETSASDICTDCHINK